MISLSLKPFVRRTITDFGARLPLRVLTRSMPRDVIVLMYHAIGEKRDAHLRNLYPYKSPAEFEADLLFLKREFPMPSWAEFVANRDKLQRPERPCVLITFDDGLSHCYRFVRPLLLKHRIPCLFFVTKAFVDNKNMFFRHKASLCIEAFRNLSHSDQDELAGTLAVESCLNNRIEFESWMLGLGHTDLPTIDRVCRLLDLDIDNILKAERPYMTTAEIQQLHADGFAVGGHSVTHPLLRLLSDEQIEFEVRESCRFVQDILRVTDVPFAFPFSADGVSRSVLRLVAQHNPWISAMFGSNGVDLDEPFLLNRISADEPPVRTAHSNSLHLIKKSYASALLRSVH